MCARRWSVFSAAGVQLPSQLERQWRKASLVGLAPSIPTSALADGSGAPIYPWRSVGYRLQPDSSISRDQMLGLSSALQVSDVKEVRVRSCCLEVCRIDASSVS